jgi:hypothetical protein
MGDEAFELARRKIKIAECQIVSGRSDPGKQAVAIRLSRWLAFGKQQVVRCRGQYLADSYEGCEVRLPFARSIAAVPTLAQARAPGDFGIRKPRLARPLPYSLGKDLHRTFCSCGIGHAQEGYVLN